MGFLVPIQRHEFGLRADFRAIRCISGDFPVGSGIVANPLISSELAGAGGRD